MEDALLIDILHPLTSARLAMIDIDAAPHDAALSFAKNGTGLIVVCHGTGKAAGVLSKSDLVRHMADPTPAAATVATLMTRHFVSCRPEDDVHSTWQLMYRRSLQNIPVLDVDSMPLGVLDIRDAMKALYEQEELQEHMLADYIAGIGYR
jgi:signal-transduction protein with cAMP-binding, CBS, and nucleotidyltransferase domain